MYNCYNCTIVIIWKVYREYFRKVLLTIWKSITTSEKGVTPPPKQQLYNCYNGTMVILEKVLREYYRKVLLTISKSNTNFKKVTPLFKNNNCTIVTMVQL